MPTIKELIDNGVIVVDRTIQLKDNSFVNLTIFNYNNKYFSVVKFDGLDYYISLAKAELVEKIKNR